MPSILVLPRAPGKLDAQTCSRLQALSSSLISDELDRAAGPRGLHYLGGGAAGTVMVGTALTVRTRSGDNLAVHHALDLARPGEVLVVDGGGELSNALLGELMMRYAAEQGLAGIVIDGAVRDIASLRTGPIPVFAAGWTHHGPYKSGPGSVHCPVSVAGAVIHSGDVVVGDEDGVVSFPWGRIIGVIDAAEARGRHEAQQLRDIQQGAWDRTWISQAAEITQL